MAEAFFNFYARKEGVDAYAQSGGTRPASRVNPLAVEVMREVGIDISSQKPQMLQPEVLKKAERIITMGCKVEDACPLLFVEAEDWEIEDPAEKSIEKFREVREVIKEKVKKLLGDFSN
jgi:protein-tyrosine-phosphatase